MITLKNITLRHGQQILFQDLNWTIYPKQRIGVIGANGSGKTSLFAMLQQQLPFDKGDIIIAKHLKIACVAQESFALDQSVLDYVMNGDHELYAIQEALHKCETSENIDNMQIATLHERLGAIDGYTAPARAAQLLDGLGFKQEVISASVSTFSGGWRMRLNLARALMSRSDILLLDEPTNHLDLDAILWLEDWLKNYSGTLLLISHDRDFLDKTVNTIAHIASQQITLYSGNYSTFEATYAQKLMLQQAAYEKQQKQLAHMQHFVDRFKAKASKARQAQSRLKAIERMELVCAVQTASAFQFTFKEPAQCPHPLLELRNASVAYSDKVVLRQIELSISPKARIAVLGPNGAGKSSLIKLLAAEIASEEGQREASSGLKIGYFAQHQVDELDLEATPLLHMQRLAERKSETELRSFLGNFGFVGEQVFKPLKYFSGGEKSRLALASIVWRQPNLLLLDEPTNHLDLDMRQALSLALQSYNGAMLLISHDRFLVRTTTDQILLIAEGKAEIFDGDVDDYEKWLLNYRKQSSVDAKSTALKKNERQGRSSPSKGSLEAKVKKLETECDRLTEKIQDVNVQLNNPDLYSRDKQDLLHSIVQAKKETEALYAQTEAAWLTACEEYEKLG